MYTPTNLSAYKADMISEYACLQNAFVHRLHVVTQYTWMQSTHAYQLHTITHLCACLRIFTYVLLL